MAHDVAIVGGGVSGLAAAYRLAPDHDVLVVDAGAVGNGTSSRASGVITPQIDYPGQSVWAEHALSFFEELDGTGVFEWTEREFVRGIRPADVEDAAERAASGNGRLVDVAEYAETFVPEAYGKALVWDHTGFCDVGELLATLHKECLNRGVEFRPDTRVEGVQTDDGDVAGLATEYGDVDADTVVVAAGSATRGLLVDVLPLPLAKFSWNVAYLDADLPEGFPMGGDPRLGTYWRRTRDGHLLVGVEHHYDGDPTVEEEVGDHLKELVRETLPDLVTPLEPDTPLVRYEACPMADTTTPDARAIIDAPAEGPNGLVVAAGFHGAGVMAADSIGTAVRALVTGEDAPFPLDPFRLDRFETRSNDFPIPTLFEQTSPET